MLILVTVLVLVDNNVLFCCQVTNIRTSQEWRTVYGGGGQILTTTETQIMQINVHICSQHLPDERRRYVPNFASDIFAKTKIPLVIILFSSHLDFRFSFNLVDKNKQ